jgi:hypothetical protein
MLSEVIEGVHRPLTRNHSSLCGILALLLFGRDAVVGSAQTVLWGAGVALIFALAWLFLFALVVDLPKELLFDLRALRRSRKPWIAEAILFLGMPFGILWIVGLMAEKYHWSPRLSPLLRSLARSGM